MRRKAASKKAAQRNETILLKSEAALKLVKQTGKPAKTRTGKGLGKAGAKRLGRLLKRAFQKEQAGRRTASQPKTPVRLFKHQIQTEAKNAPKTNMSKLASPRVSQLILNMVSQCKQTDGISIAELKRTLTAGGYRVNENDRRVTMVTKPPVNRENKKLTDTMQVRTIAVKPPKLVRLLKQSKASRKSPKVTKKPQRRAIKTHKPKRRVHKPKRRVHKPRGKTRKPAARSYKQRRKRPKARRKLPKPARKRRRPAKYRKKPRKTRRTRRPKQVRRPYRYYRKRQPPRRRPPRRY